MDLNALRQFLAVARLEHLSRAADELHVADPAEQRAEAVRLVGLGATRLDWDSYPDDPDFVVLADPDGNPFCIVDLSHD